MPVNYGLGERVSRPFISDYVEFINGTDRVLIVSETWFHRNYCHDVIPQNWFIERNANEIRNYINRYYPFISQLHKGKFETYLKNELSNHIGKMVIVHFTTPSELPNKHGTGSGTSEDLQKLQEKTQNIQTMTKVDRIVLLLTLTFKKMGKNIFDSFSMSDLYIIAGILVLWVGAQFVGIGEVVDAALVAWLWWTIGWDCWHFIKVIFTSVKIAIYADSIQQIDNAASELAPAAAALGLDAVMGFLLHKFGSGSTVEKAAQKEIKTEAQYEKVEFGEKAKAVLPKEITTADLLKQSTATKEELTQHLEYLKENRRVSAYDVKNFVDKNIWPEGQNIPRSSESILPDGSINWPLHDGFALDSKGLPILNDVSLPKGTIIDRYGGEWGRFTSPLQETGKPYSFAQRAMANIEDPRTYHQYQVLQDLNVQQGKIAPAFGDSGGGLQNVLPSSVKDLMNQGMIKEIPVK